MDLGSIVFDFDNPWVALIQVVLFYLLPRLTGWLTSKYTDARVKIAVLGASTVLTSGLTWLLDVAVGQTWATVDWTALVEVLVNAGITFAAANAVYRNVLVPTGTAAKDAENPVIKVFPDSPKRLEHEGQNLSD